jgi:hypothetical protein
MNPVVHFEMPYDRKYASFTDTEGNRVSMLQPTRGRP